MKVTKTTLDWYRQKVCRPSWAKDVLPEEQKISIDTVIASQCDPDYGRGKYHHALNLMSLCRSWRKRGVLKTKLTEVADFSTPLADCDQRSAIARRWLARILADERKVRLFAGKAYRDNGGRELEIVGRITQHSPESPYVYSRAGNWYHEGTGQFVTCEKFTEIGSTTGYRLLCRLNFRSISCFREVPEDE